MANHQLDAHQKAPETLKAFYKKYQRLPSMALDEDDNIIDFSRPTGETYEKGFRVVRTVQFPMLLAHKSGLIDCASPNTRASHSVDVFEHCSFPGGLGMSCSDVDICSDHIGLELLPALIPREVQWNLLGRLLHRDLANPEHRTNVHAHYNIPYDLCDPSALGTGNSVAGNVKENGPSFFNCDPDSSDTFSPLSPVHKPITAGQFLRRRLRWLTLGGQYDWTRKEYPQVQPPQFPKDIGDLIHGMFPHMRPEAAIVNVYSPGDTLALHRDVSENSDRGLVSISLGCDGLFIIGLQGEPDKEPRCLAIRLRSGDGVYMSGATRYAFHGLPQIIPGTCPRWLDAWPAPLELPKTEGDSGLAPGRYEAWRGWLANKRINLNVRQMNV